MPTITLSVSLGEILIAIAACAFGVHFYRHCRTAHDTADPSLQDSHEHAPVRKLLQDSHDHAPAREPLQDSRDHAPLRDSHDHVLHNRGDLVSKLAVAISLIVSRAETHAIREDDQGAQLLDALRETSLAIVETTWLRDLEKAYEDSKNRRIAAYEQSVSVDQLREKIEIEDRRLRHEIEAVSHRLEQMVDASHGRYARASDKLSAVLDRILQ